MALPSRHHRRPTPPPVSVGRTVPVDLPALTHFDECSAAVVEYLQQALPMAAWVVTRYDGDNLIALTTSAGQTAVEPGDSRPFESTLCSLVARGRIPRMVPDAAAEPLIAGSPDPVVNQMGAYVGFPIRWPDGALFGTLCAYDVDALADESVALTSLLELLSGILGAVLDADHRRADAERRADLARVEARTDHLTGLLNRRGWNRFVVEENQRWTKFGDPGTVVVADLDDLKGVNDRLGHAAGDALLVRASSVLRQFAGPADVVARLGGDEFGVVLTQCSRVDAIRRIEELRAALREADISMSTGYSAIVDAAGVSNAWAEADRAMYVAKMSLRSRNTPETTEGSASGLSDEAPARTPITA